MQRIKSVGVLSCAKMLEVLLRLRGRTQSRCLGGAMLESKVRLLILNS